jgi:hypothetical protein
MCQIYKFKSKSQRKGSLIIKCYKFNRSVLQYINFKTAEKLIPTHYNIYSINHLLNSQH